MSKADIQSPSQTMPAGPFAAPVLTVSYGTVTQEYPLSAQQITLGRAPDNSIVIPLRTVSRLHAVLTAGPGGYTITDQRSVNGLLYRGQRITEHRLMHGDVLRISDELGNFATLAYHNQAAPAAQQSVSFTFADGRQTLTIGRAPDNDLVLRHPQVSAHHARIRREGQGATLEDLHSTNGTYLRGERIERAAVQPGDIIQIAGHQLVYQAGTITQWDATEGVRLDAVGLHRTVNNGTLPLLHNISLSIYPRELVAIAGGSGAGKSTLMHALSGFAPAPAGHVFINGDDYYQHFAVYRRSLGYVPQDDILHRELTVERTLYYTARLRLPPDVSREELAQRISEVLQDVEMMHCRTVKVAHLSGGQRKRVAVALELLAQPNLFFLDEPTTGLDPGLDKRIMSLLRRLSDRGRTIILVTHATANLMLCDKVIFLARGGRLCFYGPPREALAFFETDEFSSIYTRLEQDEASSSQWEQRFLQSRYYAEYVRGRLAHLSEHLPVQPAVDTALSPPASSIPRTTRPLQEAVAGSARAAPRVSPWRQFLLLGGRYFQVQQQDRLNLILLLLQAPISGLIIALVSPVSIFADGAPPTDAQRIIFLVAIAAVLLGANNAAREIVKETPLYLRERLVNLQVVPYVLSKAAVLLLLCLVQSVLLLAALIPISGIPPEGALLPAVLEWAVSVWLTALGGMSMGLLISAFVSNSDKAISIVPLVLVPQILLAGLVFPLHGPTEVLSYTIVSRWATDSMGTTADLNRLYYQSLASAPPGLRPAALPAADDSFDLSRYDASTTIRSSYAAQSHANSRRLHLLRCWAILAGLSIAFLALTCYIQKQKDHIWKAG